MLDRQLFLPNFNRLHVEDMRFNERKARGNRAFFVPLNVAIGFLEVEFYT